MKVFHFSDVLTATTGRLVSTRHMDGVYDIYNFLTGDDLFTHRLPRAHRECDPWLRAQFPSLMADSPEMAARLEAMDASIESTPDSGTRNATIRLWLEATRVHFGLPEMIPVYEMGADMHTRINPIEEARAMVGDDRVISIEVPDAE